MSRLSLLYCRDLLLFGNNFGRRDFDCCQTFLGAATSFTSGPIWDLHTHVYMHNHVYNLSGHISFSFAYLFIYSFSSLVRDTDFRWHILIVCPKLPSITQLSFGCSHILFREAQMRGLEMHDLKI